MKILAFDSTAKAASVAVTDDGRPLGIYTIDNGLTQSELLLPMAENLLKSLKLSFSDIDAFAASAGPGSFTGVRIGIALIKGLAFSKNKPCCAISTLDAISENLFPLSGVLIPCMDARRNQVYSATFISDGETLTRKCADRAISIDELAAELKEYEGEDIYLAGDGYEVLRDGLLKRGIAIKKTPALLINENAYSCAAVALRELKEGRWVSDTNAAPTYLRLPQAERERLEREKQNKNR